MHGWRAGYIVGYHATRLELQLDRSQLLRLLVVCVTLGTTPVHYSTASIHSPIDPNQSVKGIFRPRRSIRSIEGTCCVNRRFISLDSTFVIALSVSTLLTKN